MSPTGRRIRGGMHVVLPLCVGVAGFLMSFLASDRLINDHFLILARAYQVLHGAWPLRDFFDPGMPLGYLPDAAVMYLSGSGLYAEVLLTSAYFATGLAMTFVLVRRASSSTLLALLAAVIVFIVPPRLYSMSKVLVVTVALVIAWWYADAPGTRRLAALGAWAGVAFLIRHDYGVYLTLAVTALLLTVHGGFSRSFFRSVLVYLAVLMVIASPWLIYAQWTMGLGAYFGTAARWAAAESARTNRLSWTMVAFAAVPVIALGLAPLRSRGLPAQHVVFAAVLVLCIDIAFLRASLEARVPDVIAATVVVASLIVGKLPRPVLPAAMLLAGVVIGWTIDRRPPHVFQPSIWEYRARALKVAFEEVDPDIVPANDTVPLIQYLSRCTPRSASILVAGFAPQIASLAGHRFAGGTPAWLADYFSEPSDRRRAEAWLWNDPVGAAVMMEGAERFTALWPGVAGDLRARGWAPYQFTTPSIDVPVWLPARAIDAPRDPASGLPCPGR